MTVSSIPGYRIIREIGQGGMAVVYLAMQESLNRNVALKVMSPLLLAADKTFGDRFLKEGRIVAKLRHPGIVQVYDIGASEDSFYIAMEHVAGGDLAGRIRHGLTGDEAMNVLRQMTEALAYAHDKGYVHRDIKPENILFNDHGQAVLTDFGVARAMRSGTRMTRAGMTIGTPQYMSPEQLKAEALDGRSDLYSLGILLYEMLTGAVPYDADDTYAIGIRHINDPLPVLPANFSRYQVLLDILLAKHPNDRFADARELLSALDTLAAGGTIRTKAKQKHRSPLHQTEILETIPSGPGMHSSSARLYWGLGGTLLALAIFVWVVLGSDKNDVEVQRDGTTERHGEAEQQRGAELARQRLAEEQRRAEEQREAELAQQRQAEEQREAELAQQRQAEEQRRAEDQREAELAQQRQAEEQRRAEEQRESELAQQRQAEEQRRAEERRQAEERQRFENLMAEMESALRRYDRRSAEAHLNNAKAISADQGMRRWTDLNREGTARSRIMFTLPSAQGLTVAIDGRPYRLDSSNTVEVPFKNQVALRIQSTETIWDPAQQADVPRWRALSRTIDLEPWHSLTVRAELSKWEPGARDTRHVSCESKEVITRQGVNLGFVYRPPERSRVVDHDRTHEILVSRHNVSPGEARQLVNRYCTRVGAEVQIVQTKPGSWKPERFDLSRL